MIPIWNKAKRAIVIVRYDPPFVVRYVIDHEGNTLASKLLVGEATMRARMNDNEVQS